MKNLLIIVLFFGYSLGLFSQGVKRLEALNNYVSFANESTHGLLIVHRLLENYNQEINKFVDLPGYQLNNISNKDLPRNIFKDTDHWFYEETPYELFDRLKNDSGIIGKSNHDLLFPISKDILRTINKINNIRFEIADMISKKKKKKDNLNDIYLKLEKVVDLFDLYYAYILNLKSTLSKIKIEENKGKLGSILFDVYDESMNVLTALRVNDIDRLRQNRIQLQYKLSILGDYNSKSYNSKKKVLSNKIFKLNSEIFKLTGDYLASQNVPKEYELYGSCYYYYNVKVIDRYNRYGNGFISILNKLLQKEKLSLLEYPHYFKVIYPKKKVKKTVKFKTELANISSLPKSLSKRSVKINSKQIIYVDSCEIKLELFDNKIQDGDIVSINFNGKWIFENLSLETKPKVVNLVLNKKGKNYIVLHAVNVGRQPPNTIGINYTYLKEKKTIVLESNLNYSDIIEIRIKDNN